MVDGILSLNPDVVVLTEFVPGKSRDQFIKDLVNAGLVHIRISNFVPKQNSVFVASKYLLNTGEVKPPCFAPSIQSNFIHLELPTEGIHLIAIRIPDYSKFPRIKREYWDWIIEMAGEFRDINCVMCGDFNTSPEYTKAKCGDRIKMLADLGWNKASPEKGYSYWNPRGYGVQIDHAFINGSLVVEKSEYVTEKNGFCFVGKNSKALSDHAILDFEIKE